MDVGSKRASTTRFGAANIVRHTAAPVHVAIRREFESHRNKQSVAGRGSAQQHVPKTRLSLSNTFQPPRQPRSKGGLGTADDRADPAQELVLLDEPAGAAVPPRSGRKGCVEPGAAQVGDV